MTIKLLTADEFRAGAQNNAAPDGVVLRLASEQPEVLTENRTIRFVFSDDSVDRAGDRIEVNGWDTSAFVKNPVALWAHMSWEPPIGRAKNVHVSGNKLVGDIEFASADISPRADEIYRLVKGGYINAVSVGFIPREWSFTNDKNRPYGIDFKKQELMEISVCPVPCNANALTEARAKGLLSRDMDALWVKLLAGTVARASDWKSGAGRDLPIDDAAAWDGGAAEKEIFDHAGGDDFDPEKARKGFLLYDASAPKQRGSYKEPFCRVIGGELKAVKGGIDAAASRLPQTDVPDAAKSEARAVLDHYEERMKKTAPSQQTKGGRRISAATMAKLEEALGHHEATAKCIRDVMASNDPDGDGDDDSTDPADENDPVKRAAATRRWLASLSL